MPADQGESATVRVEEGQLRGRKVESRAGGHFWSFQGVPYARPPLGPLRFKDPQPVEPWEGVRDALKEGDVCPQLNFMTKELNGSEDCLFLNVYTPTLYQPGVNPLPVMVSIHGGGFEMGAGDSNFCGPDYLVAEDVIVVTLNYRLNVFGFLYLEEACPGNVGLKDQVAALRWLQRNIAAFGGDPSNVTIFGVSAGGASVHMHMYSPMSKGLFHRAIAMSGSGLNPWAKQRDPAKITRRLAELLGCTSEDKEEIINFLRGVDHMKLLRVAMEDVVPNKAKNTLLGLEFVPTDEKLVPGIEPFFPEPLEDLTKKGAHHDVSFITGTTEREGLLVYGMRGLSKDDVAREIDSNWEAFLLRDLHLQKNGDNNEAAFSALRQFFMDGKPLSKDTAIGFCDMLSDITFDIGVNTGLRAIAKTCTKPLYHYVFTVDDAMNWGRQMFNADLPGTTHGDDICYLYRCDFGPDISEDSSAALARRRFVKLWTNYAKTGNPTPTDDSLLGVRWQPYTEKERNYLDIGNELRPGKDLHADRVAFWEKFYVTYAP